MLDPFDPLTYERCFSGGLLAKGNRRSAPESISTGAAK
jgi:hypothetical protein